MMTLREPVPPQMVKTQLDRIMNSRQFCNAPRLSRFLSYVVEEVLAGRVDRLKGYVIGLEVFDKTEDFDPQTDTIVRVQARSLRQKLDQYYAQDGARDPVRICIAKGSYEPTFAYAEDMDIGDDQAADAPSAKPSIAVLPFDDFSQHADNDFFASGLTEEIIVDLSRFKELSVFSRATTQQAKIRGMTIQQMRDSFHPDFVLEGSLRADAQTISITINLVETSEDKVILVDQFDTPMDPTAIYRMQDRIAEQIASRISDRFGPIGQFAKRADRVGQSLKWETINWIYRYHRKGIELDREERALIRAGLENAVAMDPSASNAYAVLAFLWLDDYRLEIGDTPAGILDRALALAQQAVDCDNESAAAHCAMALAQFHLGHLAAFHRAADQAVKLNPGNADMLAMLGMCFMVRGDAAHALPMLDKAVQLNPLHPGWYRLIRALIVMQLQGPEAALAEMRIDPLPEKFFYTCHLIWMLVEAGDIDGALREKAALLNRFPEFERFIGPHYRACGVAAALERRVFAAWRKVGLHIAPLA